MYLLETVDLVQVEIVRGNCLLLRCRSIGNKIIVEVYCLRKEAHTLTHTHTHIHTLVPVTFPVFFMDTEGAE